MTSQFSQALKVVQVWHTALNNQDMESLANLVHKEVKIGGPRGSVAGVNVMLEWVDRARVSLTPLRYFQDKEQDKEIVVEELGEWHDPDTGAIMSRQIIATIFTVKDHRISSVFRYNTLKEAFEASGLSEKNEVAV